MKIEWATEAYYHRDGSLRKQPLPSVMHGWLAKMRGTLLGDEQLRTRGIKEMKAARSYQKQKKALEARRPKPRSAGVFSFLRSSHKKKPRRSNTQRSTQRPPIRQHSSRSSRRAAGPAPQVNHRPSTTRRNTVKRGASTRTNNGPPRRPSARR
ncbi:hypothetical protein PQX77_003530 [Marasmius sp. AFHP31]|nr:hypothetical protein PQX77_003530 [Marasmius sp. AFHP31]